MKKNTGIRTGVFVVIVVVICAAIYGVLTYNQLASAENNVDTKWAQVENVMQRRADLIPNLVSSVKGSMKQEQKVFGEIAESRKMYQAAKTPTEKDQANQALDKNLSVMVNAIHENYPELQSNENVKTLMTQLEGTENRISVERRDYIQEVNHYNQQLVKFPKNIVAKIVGFEKKDNFKADKGAEKAPKVDLE